MKISQKNYGYLKEAIKDAVEYAEIESGKTLKQWREQYHEDKLTEKRFRWDLFWAGKSYLSSELRNNIVHGLKDEHIDTALKRIVKELLI